MGLPRGTKGMVGEGRLRVSPRVGTLQPGYAVVAGITRSLSHEGLQWIHFSLFLTVPHLAGRGAH